MRLRFRSLILASALLLLPSDALTSTSGLLSHQGRRPSGRGSRVSSPLAVLAGVSQEGSTETISTTEDEVASTGRHSLTRDLIHKLRYRELTHELEVRGESIHGTTGQLRTRLRQVAFPDEECAVNEDGSLPEECDPMVSVLRDVAGRFPVVLHFPYLTPKPSVALHSSP
jgi:hypothetical protein